MEFPDELCEDLYEIADLLKGRSEEIDERGCHVELLAARMALSKLYVALYGPNDPHKLN